MMLFCLPGHRRMVMTATGAGRWLAVLALGAVLLTGVAVWGATASAPPAVKAAPSPGYVWPTPNKAFMQGGDIGTWAQDTGTGDPHSGLFGCVRDDGHKFHEGIDIKCLTRDKKGEPVDPVFAAFDGVVAYINTTPGNSSYGRYIVLNHPAADVAVYTLYAHLSAIGPGVAVGQKVSMGATIATMGHSGTENIPSARAHMHFEIGLRLSDTFQPWYDSKKLGSPNEHGLYNGMNLVGMDPLVFFEAVRAGKFHNFRDFIEGLPTAFTLRVSTGRVPDFATRYPALLSKPVPKTGLAGWDVDFTWFGMPKKLTPLPAGTPGLGAPGTIALVSFNRDLFTGCACRQTLIFDAAKPSATPRFGTDLDDYIKLLFGFK